MNVLLNFFHLLRPEVCDLISLALKINFCGRVYPRPYLKVILIGRTWVKGCWLVGPQLAEPGVTLGTIAGIVVFVITIQTGQKVDFFSFFN